MSDQSIPQRMRRRLRPFRRLWRRLAQNPLAQQARRLDELERQVSFLRGTLPLAELARRPQGAALKVNLGAGGLCFPEWIATEYTELDITNPHDWQRWFQPASIDRLLAEHVLEHLSLEENRIAMAECYAYLKPGGKIRIAVPDGHRKDPRYVNEVAPPADGHQSLFTVESMTVLLSEAGFVVRPLEFFDEHETFHSTNWDVADGWVRRSVRFDTQMAFMREGLFYTSLIVDGIK